MNNIFHRLSPRELEDAVIEYLATNKQRHDLVTLMINNVCSFSFSKEGDLLCKTNQQPESLEE
tara:strand:+ start:706 stop:894 length:189 start_codon:yes stop_codon:yes gene_type:complete